MISTCSWILSNNKLSMDVYPVTGIHHYLNTYEWNILIFPRPLQRASDRDVIPTGFTCPLPYFILVSFAAQISWSPTPLPIRTALVQAWRLLLPLGLSGWVSRSMWKSLKRRNNPNVGDNPCSTVPIRKNSLDQWGIPYEWLLSEVSCSIGVPVWFTALTFSHSLESVSPMFWPSSWRTRACRGEWKVGKILHVES